jgi:hypothetical protein
MAVGVGTEVLLMGGLGRLVRPLMLMCMGCFVDGVDFSYLARLAILAKLVVMSCFLRGCEKLSRSGPFG